MDKSKSIKFTLVILVIWILYYAESEPKKFLLNESGEITSLGGKFKEVIQKEKFWQNQLALINENINWIDDYPKRRRKTQELMEEVIASNERIVKKYDKRTPAEKYADELRRQADQIDSDVEYTQTLNDLKEKRVILFQLKSFVEAKIREQ